MDSYLTGVALMTGVYPGVELPTLPNVPDVPDAGQHTVEVCKTLTRTLIGGLMDLTLDREGHATENGCKRDEDSFENKSVWKCIRNK